MAGICTAWLAMLDVPDIDYRAMWGADSGDIYAVGSGGVAQYDGTNWQRVVDVPEVEYRAVWGRSGAQVWIGGDNTLLAKSLSGWQQQSLWHDGFEIVEYSVLALIGDSRREYALVQTGGQVLLLINEGALWETPYWRGGNGPGSSLPLESHAVVYYGELLVGGQGDLVRVRKDEFLWESYRWPAGYDLPPLTAMAGDRDYVVAAGDERLFVYQDCTGEFATVDDERPIARTLESIYAVSPDRFFAVGSPVQLDGPDAHSGVQLSPVAACDTTDCALEAMESGHEASALHAVWGDGAGTVMAAGNGVIFVRQLKE